MAQRAKARARLLVALVLACSRPLSFRRVFCPPPPPPPPPRVYTRVCACRYTACTLVKIQSEHESAMGTFIVHSYVVLSALHYAIVFSTRPLPLLPPAPAHAPARASFNNAHYDNIPLWLRLGRREGGEANTPSRVLIFIYVRRQARETTRA